MASVTDVRKCCRSTVDAEHLEDCRGVCGQLRGCQITDDHGHDLPLEPEPDVPEPPEAKRRRDLDHHDPDCKRCQDPADPLQHWVHREQQEESDEGPCDICPGGYGQHDGAVHDRFDREQKIAAAANGRVRGAGHGATSPLRTTDEWHDRHNQQRALERIGRELLEVLGDDPNRPGIVDTPRRWAAWWQEFLHYEPGNMDTTFETSSVDQLVAVSGIRVWSLCEHHLLPFFCDLTIAYIAKERVLGLSKFARIAHAHAHRLQLQEQLVAGIADELMKVTGTDDVAVIGRGEHLCMTMRGIRSPAIMTSSVTHGLFREDGRARNELMTLVAADNRTT